MAEIYTLLLPNGVQYPYKIVSSKRAKYIRIKLTQQGNLSITIPEFTHMKFAHEFIDSKVNWVLKNLAKVKIPEEIQLPDTLDLKLLQEIWTVLYTDTQQCIDDPMKCIEKENNTLELQGGSKQLIDIDLVSKVLNKWCRKKSKKIFNEMLQNLAEIHGFHYQRLSIRTQKTRWGSCSNKKNINLNSKLLFMPEDIVKYVMVHELCHTIEMNHSSRFWSLVDDCDPHYKYHKQQLKSLAETITI